MEPLLTATYFPFSTISWALLEVFSCVFDRITLFQPAGIASTGPAESLTQWIDKGFLDLRKFSATPVDEEQLVGEIYNWKAWGNTHQHEDLKYIKQMRDGLAPSSPIVPTMVSAIKGSTGTKAPENPHFEYHLFLSLAHDFDQQSLELETQLTQVKKQRESLQAFLQMDALDEERQKKPETFFEVPQDLGALMTENRLTSWSHLFCREETDAHVLVTDSPATFRLFLESIVDKEPIGEFIIRDQGQNFDGSGWQGPLRQLFFTLLSNPWNESIRKETETTVGKLRDLTMTDRGGKEWHVEANGGTISFRWVLVPGTTGKSLFQGYSGLTQKTVKPKNASVNTLIGLVDPRGLS